MVYFVARWDIFCDVFWEMNARVLFPVVVGVGVVLSSCDHREEERERVETLERERYERYEAPEIVEEARTPGQKLDRALERTEGLRREATEVTGKTLQVVGQGLEEAASRVQREIEEEKMKERYREDR